MYVMDFKLPVQDSVTASHCWNLKLMQWYSLHPSSVQTSKLDHCVPRVHWNRAHLTTSSVVWLTKHTFCLYCNYIVPKP